MVTIDDDARQYINSEFAKRLEEEGASPIEILVETQPGAAEDIADEIVGLDAAQLSDAGVIGPDYVALVIDGDDISKVARLEAVEKVHYDQPVSVTGGGVTSRLPSLPTFVQNPVQRYISKPILDGFSPSDKYLGSGGVSPVEVPGINFAQLPPGDPLQIVLSIADNRTGSNFTNKQFVPTSESVEWIRDSPLTDGSAGIGSQVAILDTGHTPLEPNNAGRAPRLESSVPGEPPTDFHGHGSWCTNTVVGAPAPSTWGRVQGVAEEAQYGHFKCLNSFPGFGQTSWILDAMERALDWGADVISLSLGGVQQGSIEEEPFSRYIRKRCKENRGDEDGAIFVVAAGNAGPERFTVGSPGVAEKAITVASWSMLDSAPSNFSSRGPQGDWYADNQRRFDEDREQYSEGEFIKPDVAAPGGGRISQELADQNDELLHQVSTGWMEGIHDGLRDTRGLMKGTSMACPHVAGLVTRLYDAGIVQNAREVKQVVRDNSTTGPYPDAATNATVHSSGKSIAVGFGPIRESLFEPN